MQIIVFLLGLSLLIKIHELGHFIVAKLFGVYCHEFSIGMGPAIFSKKKGETKYSIRCLPIGGYVSMAGEEVNTENKGDDTNNDSVANENEEKDNSSITKEELPDIPYERTINGIKAWKRFLVIGAGVFMNFVLAFILFFIYIAAVGLPDEAPRINVDYSSDMNEIYAFKEANIKEGTLEISEVNNRIVYIHNGTEVTIFEKKYSETLTSYDNLSQALGVPSEIGESIADFDSDIVKNDEEEGYQSISFESNQYVIKQYLTIVSDENVYDVNRNITGLVFYKNIADNTYTIKSSVMLKLGYTQCARSATLGECFKYAGQLELKNGLAIFEALGNLFTKEGIQNVGGVIAMADASNTFLSYGFGYYMYFLGVISVNLGVMNLLPIPGLDGSQLIVIIVEGVTRKKLPDNVKAIVNFIGLIFLLGLMLLITIKDVFTFLI